MAYVRDVKAMAETEDSLEDQEEQISTSQVDSGVVSSLVVGIERHLFDPAKHLVRPVSVQLECLIAEMVVLIAEVAVMLLAGYSESKRHTKLKIFPY